MRVRLRGSLCIAFLCAALALRAGDARAQDKEPARVDPRIFSAFAEVTLAGPFGWLGAGIAVRPLPWFSVQGGGGAGISGPQLGVGTGFHVPLADRELLGVLLAFSYDQYRQEESVILSDFYRVWDTYWGYLGIQGRKHLVGPLFLRGTIGVTTPLRAWSPECHADDAARLADCRNTEFDGDTAAFGGVGLELEVF